MRGGARRPGARRSLSTLSPLAEGAPKVTYVWVADGPLSAACEGAEEGGDAGFGHLRVLRAVAAAHADTAHHLALDLDGKAADEDGELARVHRLDAESLVARERGPRGRRVERVSGAPVARGR